MNNFLTEDHDETLSVQEEPQSKTHDDTATQLEKGTHKDIRVHISHVL